MAKLIDQVMTEVRVDHRSFNLLDDGGPQCARVDFSSTTQWLFVGDNEIAVCSPLSYHVATVTVEAWDAKPPVAVGWAVSRSAQLRLDSGLVEINPLVEGEDAEAIEVGRPGTYRVRAYVSSRDELLPFGLDVEPVGIERYLFQLWPYPVTT